MNKLIAGTLALITIALVPAEAQETASNGPMSAIDWLSDTVVVHPSSDNGSEGLIGDSVTTEAIETAPLATLAIDGVGLLPSRVTGLPTDFWGPTSARELVTLIGDLRLDLPRPSRELLFQILLAELNPPVDAGPDHALFLARIDALLRFGALEQAQALLERAGPTNASLFRRWFDVSLLSGNEDRACAVMRAAPDVAPTFSARVFCLARGNDWSAAALSLDTARALGVLSEADDLLLARFLDPELFEGQPMAPLPSPLTPLCYRMLVALGEAPSTTTLPIAFAHAALEPVTGWKARLEAAERLVRTGGLAPTQLFALYTERRAAASGGLWERVSTVQAIDAALLGGDDEALWEALPRAAHELDNGRLFQAFAQHYGPRLAERPVPKTQVQLRDRIVLLSAAAETAAPNVRDPYLAAIAQGLPPVGGPDDALHSAIASAFQPGGGTVPETFEALIAQARLGETVLRSLALLNEINPDPGDVEAALSVLRRLGFESSARATALSLLLANGEE